MLRKILVDVKLTAGVIKETISLVNTAVNLLKSSPNPPPVINQIIINCVGENACKIVAAELIPKGVSALTGATSAVSTAVKTNNVASNANSFISVAKAGQFATAGASFAASVVGGKIGEVAAATVGINEDVGGLAGSLITSGVTWYYAGTVAAACASTPFATVACASAGVLSLSYKLGNLWSGPNKSDGDQGGYNSKFKVCQQEADTFKFNGCIEKSFSKKIAAEIIKVDNMLELLIAERTAECDAQLLDKGPDFAYDKEYLACKANAEKLSSAELHIDPKTEDISLISTG